MKGDAGRLRQILLHLGGNAVKFTSEGQRILVVDDNTTNRGVLTGPLLLCGAEPGFSPTCPKSRSYKVNQSRDTRFRHCGASTRNGILLVEDNLVNQKVAIRMLEKLDYRVDVVDNGMAAIAAWQTGRYDLILMDCQMPELDGYETTREIRRLENDTRPIPIVALTAHAMKGADEECIAAGMDGYLSKPVNRDELDAALSHFLREEVASQPRPRAHGQA